MAGNDVFLYSVPAGASPTDVRLRDPTTTSGPVAYNLTGDAGAYALTGQTATFKTGRLLSGATGSYALSGQAATLTYIPGIGSVAYSLSGAKGAYALTGQAAGFNVGRLLSGSAGAYSVSGQDGTLTYTPGSAPEVRTGGGGRAKSKRKLPDWYIRRGISKPRDIEPEILPEPEKLPEFDIEALLSRLEAARDAKLEAELAIMAAKTSSGMTQARQQFVQNQINEKRILATLEELDIAMIAALVL